MNKKFPTLAIAVAAFCLASCHCDDDTSTTSKYITVATSIGQMTRTTTDANGNQEFAKDDQISIYAWTGNATAVPADFVVKTVSTPTMVLNGQLHRRCCGKTWKRLTTSLASILTMP